MWMMGYNDGGDLYMHHDSFNNSRRLRPLMPRPIPTATSPNGVATGGPPSGFSRIQGADILAFNHHFANVAEQSKRDQMTTTQQVVVSSRWNPTPEQLQTLEELYRRGTRTPSADQIQHITAQLRRYGKIEGKNVFYWFQNHKARERQKRRRQMESGLDDQNRDAENSEIRKEAGASRAVIEAEQTKNWTPSSNCSTLAEESVVSVQKTAKASTVTEFRTTTTSTDHRWVKFMERNDTWPSMHGLSCPQVINTITAPPHSSELSREIIMDHSKLTRTTTSITTTNHDLLINNIFLTPCKDDNNQIDAQIYHYYNYDNNEDCIDSQTLQLFPLRSGVGESTDDGAEEKGSAATTLLVSGANDFTTPHKFFEFLPIKH